MNNPNKLPDFVDDLLNNSWEQLCFIAYDGFTSRGRGVIAVFPDDDGVNYLAEYIVYDLDKLNESWFYVVRDYEPETEFVLQFTDESQNIRTVRIRTPEDGQHPKRIWFFQALEETMENPETLKNRPQWFINALNDLNKSAIKDEE